MKTLLITAGIAVGMLSPLILCAQVQPEWRGIFSELEVSPHQSLSTNVISIMPDSLWHTGLFCYAPGGIKELSKQAVYLQKRFSEKEQIRCYYETRRFNQYAENTVLVGYAKKYSNLITAGLTMNYQSQKFSDDYLVKSSLLVQPSCLIQFSNSLNVYSRLSIATLKTAKRIDNLVLAMRYDYSKSIMFNVDASLSQVNADCYVGISYFPSDDFKMQLRFDCLSAATALQIAYAKKRMGFVVGSKYNYSLGLSPFVGITTTL
jgi:hypothetical protein